MDLSFYAWIFGSFAFVMGAIVGSFLNVCIYRLPLGLSVNQPRRSFCPHCKNQISWFRNIPLISWVALRGKCADCGCRISFRYFGVELITALLFLGIWVQCWNLGLWILALPYWILAGLLIVATFIDFEYFIIPDEISLGGMGAGIILGFAIPILMHEESHLAGAFWSMIGAAVGYGSLRAVVELGKMAFGKKRVVLESIESFTWIRHGEDAELKVGSDVSLWSDYFTRDTDQFEMSCTGVEIDGNSYGTVDLNFSFNRLVIGEKEFELDKVDQIAGNCSEFTFPREAMGLGDVKFIAAIGAFLGWQAVFFTIMSASILGAVFGIVTIFVRKREWSAKIPFGPYLALGAFIWMFAGWPIVHWYFRQLR